MSRNKIVCVVFLCCVARCLGGDLTSDWEYHFGAAGRGTRSEDEWGKLSFQRGELPGYFTHVVTPIGEFGFANVCGFSGVVIGWKPEAIDEKGELWCPANEAQIGEFLNRKDPKWRTTKVKETRPVSDKAFLEGSLTNPPRGVGANWFYAIDHGIWVNPEKLSEISAASLPKLK